MEFITSNKGSRKLCYAGYAYTKKKESKTTVRWECTHRSSKQCKGALTTDCAATEVKSTTEHNHEADLFAIAAMKVKSEIKATVQANRGKPGQIVTDKLATVPKEVASAAGRVDSLKRVVRRAKRGTAPSEPATRQDIPYPLPEEYTTMRGDGSFLIYDNGSRHQRLLVFASGDGFELLENADTWFMDGTHSTAPSQFPQLFCIRVPLGETCVSAAYALLPSKHQEVYEECLTALLDACLRKDIRPNPKRIVADYEVAIHNAVRAVISANIHIQGCFYHLTQSTWRRVQSEGLQNLYKSDEEVRIFCGMLDALAFLPVDRVKEGMRILKETAPENLNGLIEYFDGTYVSGNYRAVVGEEGRMRFRRTTPRFPPQIWNVHDATVTDQHRTNNMCESWNNGFKHLVGHNNPSLWTVIQCLQRDAALVETEVYSNQQGQPALKRKRKNTLVHQKRLKTLCLQLNNGQKTLAQFLHTMGQCIRLH